MRWESGEEMARALEAACRVSGGRARVAEHLEELLVRPRDGELSDRTALEPSPPPLPPPPVPSAIAQPPMERPVAQPFRPRSITEMVRPLPSPRTRRGWPLIGLSALIGFGLAVGVPLLARRVRPVVAGAPSQQRPRHAPLRLGLRIKPVPSPTVVAATPPPEVVLSSPQPTHVAHRSMRHIAAPPPEPVETAPPPPVEKPQPTIQDGRLLDPFGAP
jgi:hypothetical protein